MILLFASKMSLSSQKYGFGIRGTRSRIRKNQSRIQGAKKHRVSDPDLPHCLYVPVWIELKLTIQAAVRVSLHGDGRKRK
jgi:hypothetical protein